MCCPGRITREEYRAIAKKATNKVKMKTKVRLAAKLTLGHDTPRDVMSIHTLLL